MANPARPPIDGDIFGGPQPMIRSLVASSGKSMRRVSHEIGRSENYLSAMLRNGTVPSVSLLADIAAACGYQLAVIGRDDAFVLHSWEYSPEEADSQDFAGFTPVDLENELRNTGRAVASVLANSAVEERNTAMLQELGRQGHGLIRPDDE